MQEDLLVKQSLKGDQTAFEQLVLLYERNIYNIAYHYLQDREAAMDMTQESFLKAYQSLANLEDQAAFGAWLKRICRNKCMDYLRKNKENTLSLEEMLEGENGPKDLPAKEPSPERSLAAKEEMKNLENLLRNLPLEYKEVLLLRVFEEYSYEEIAEAVHCSIGTVKSRLFRAKKLLQKQLSEGRE